jgi:hypothetical protein
MDNGIRILADKLFFDLPFWKRSMVAKWYKRNNWDVLGIYADCVKQAVKMCEEREGLIDKLRI